MFIGDNNQVSVGMIPDIARTEKFQVNGDIMVVDESGNKTGVLERINDMYIYSDTDILKAYMMLSANKTYHTTYCNILNNMLYNATDMESIKNITYGMEITDKKYLDVLNEVNNSKDILLNLAEQLIEKMNSKEENVLENEKKNQGVDNE